MKKKEPNLFDKILSIYEKLKFHVTYIILVFIAAYELFPIDQFFPQANTIVLVTLGFILLEIFFQMYKKISAVDKYYVFETGPDMLEKFESDALETKRGKPVEISMITLASRVYLHPAFSIMNKFLREKRPFNFEIATLSEQYIVESNHFTEGNTKKYLEAVKYTKNQIEVYKEEHKEELEESGSVIKYYTYEYMPNYIGILLNERFLYLSHTMWNGGFIVGANNNRYELYKMDDKYDGDYKIDNFKSWLDYIRLKNVPPK